tara:strand:+ start:129 stop:560 length:432 start_codon:yes stop_codon:yes gene_type:complete
MNLAELIINLHSNTLSPIRHIAKKYSLSGSQLLCITNIPPNGISQTKLAKLLSIDLSTLSRNLSKLIDMDMLIKSNNQYDNRSYKILLTQKGENLYKVVFNSLENYLEIESLLLDSEEYELMLDSIIKLNWLLLKKKSHNASM